MQEKLQIGKRCGGKDAPIRALQRPENSGSQTGIIELVMKGKKLMKPITENIAQSMSDIIGIVSDYDNGENSIGYSYYYYATTMYDTEESGVTDGIKLIGIDGIKPTAETIRNETYPLNTAYYIVINKAESENSDVRKLVNAMLNTRGQNVAEEAGYVRIK